MLATLLAALDQTIVSTALPTIVGDLGGLSHLSWVVTAYLLALRQLPIGVIALVVIMIVLPGTGTRARHKIDYLGAQLLASTATCLVLLTSWGGSEYRWGSPVIIGLGVLAVALAIGWWLSARRAAEPVLPLRLFQNRVFSVASAIGFAAGFAMFGALAFLPLFLHRRPR